MENPATPPPARLHWSALTDRGRFRANNEDAFLALAFDGHEVRYLGKTGQASLAGADYVFAVSDGMGGAKSGEFASRIAVDRITRLLPRAFRMSAAGLASGFNDVLTELFLSIHADLLKLGSSYDECSGMGATLSLGWFTPEWMYFAHLGDSRIYYLPHSGGLTQLTHDHSHVGALRRSGQLNEREARMHPRRNALQQALGAGHQFVEPHIGAVGPGFLQAGAAARHLEHIPECGNNRARNLRQRNRFIDVRGCGHANRATRPGNQIDVCRQEFADAEMSDGVGVTAADFHYSYRMRNRSGDLADFL